MRQLNYDELLRRLAFSERQRHRMRRTAARLAGEDDGANWTIADLMTLLLIFFILMYAGGDSRGLFAPHAGKPSPVAPRIVRHKIAAPPPAAAGAVLPPGSPRPAISDPETPAAEPAPERTPAVVAQPPPSPSPLQLKVDAFMKANAGQGIQVRWEEKRPVFILSEKITFLMGQADLLDTFRPTLLRMADFIAQQPGQRVQVTGHTDDTPIHNFRFPSNWELSAARAASVARFLIANGVDPSRVTIQGYASYRPVAPNDSVAHRQANRRVEITLIEK